jgi:hypothetical protein
MSLESRVADEETDYEPAEVDRGVPIRLCAPAYRPHRDRVGLAYVCCIDCGRELPYSVQQMKIVTRQ